MVKGALRLSLRWWVFLPLAPVLFLALLEAVYEALSYCGLYRAASVIDAISIFITVVPLMPYWGLSVLLFGVHASTPFGLQLLAIAGIGLLLTVVLFILNFLRTMASPRAPRTI